MIRFSIIVPTSGRPTLADTINSITAQAAPGDELIVGWSDDDPWGNRTRQNAMRRATGTHLLFIDDDDVYEPWAFKIMRPEVAAAPNRIHIFCMAYPHGGTLWRGTQLQVGNVGTPMIVVPNQPGTLGTWADEYEADFRFLAETLERRGDNPIWHPETVVRIRPHQRQQHPTGHTLAEAGKE